MYNSIHLDSWLVNITCRVFLEVRPSMYLALDLIASYLLDSVVSWGERDKWLPIYNVSEQGNFATSMSKHRRLACSAEIKIVRSQVENLRKRKRYNFDNVLYNSSFTSPGHLEELIRANGNYNSNF